MPPLRIGILVSGQGSVLKSVLRACADGRVAGEVAAVGSNRDCPALDVARDAAIQVVVKCPLSQFASQTARDSALASEFRRASLDVIVVGGYNEPLEAAFIDEVGADVIGMYPALLPAFGELPEAIGPALDYGVKTIGVTIHFRTPMTGSGGPIIAQEPLPVDLDDDVEGVTARVVELESRFLPRILQAFAEGRVTREGSRVRVR